MTDAPARARRRRLWLAIAEWGAAIVLVGWVALCLAPLVVEAFRVDPTDRFACGTPVLASGFGLTPAAVLFVPLLGRWWRSERRGDARSLALRARLAVCSLAWLLALLLSGLVWSFLVLEVLVA